MTHSYWRSHQSKLWGRIYLSILIYAREKNYKMLITSLTTLATFLLWCMPALLSATDYQQLGNIDSYSLVLIKKLILPSSLAFAVCILQ